MCTQRCFSRSVIRRKTAQQSVHELAMTSRRCDVSRCTRRRCRCENVFAHASQRSDDVTYDDTHVHTVSVVREVGIGYHGGQLALKRVLPAAQSRHCSNLLDFVVNRLFMKLFKTSNVDTVNYCRTEFQFDLPCIVLEQRYTFVS